MLRSQNCVQGLVDHDYFQLWMNESVRLPFWVSQDSILVLWRFARVLDFCSIWGHIISLWGWDDWVPNYADEIIVVKASSWFFLLLLFLHKDLSTDLQAYESRAQRSLWLQNPFSLPLHFIVSDAFGNKLREQLIIFQLYCKCCWGGWFCSILYKITLTVKGPLCLQRVIHNFFFCFEEQDIRTKEDNLHIYAFLVIKNCFLILLNK